MTHRLWVLSRRSPENNEGFIGAIMQHRNVRGAHARYTILGPIHRGGMGEILLARIEGAEGFRRKVVLKGILPSLKDDTVSLELFRREATIMSSLEHPNIVRVVDFTYIDDKPYLAMEYVRGRNVDQVIQQVIGLGQKLPMRIVAHIVAEALRGIHYAHTATDETGRALGIVHRDISPGNLLVSYLGEVKVTDFGIAKTIGARHLTAPRSIRGKARYAAPELISGGQATIHSDIYSAAVVLAEALTATPLWPAKGLSETLLQIVSEPREKTIARIQKRLPEPAPEMLTLLQRALAMRPADRPPTALRFAEMLDAIALAAGRVVSRQELGAWMRQLFRASENDVDHAELINSARLAPEPRPDVHASTEKETPRERPRQEPLPLSPSARVAGSIRPPHWRTASLELAPSRAEPTQPASDQRCPLEVNSSDRASARTSADLRDRLRSTQPVFAKDLRPTDPAPPPVHIPNVKDHHVMAPARSLSEPGLSRDEPESDAPNLLGESESVPPVHEQKRRELYLIPWGWVWLGAAVGAAVAIGVSFFARFVP